MTTTAWLLAGDPALRWQVERDLLDAPEAVWQATRARVATEGMAPRLLALQDPDGQWAGGAYFPARHDPRAHPSGEGPAQPWTATTWSLNQLREWGVAASALGNTADLLHQNARWEYDDLPYWDGEVDCCINAFTLANGAWLGADVSGLVGWFAEHQLPDGGWNCEWVEGSTRSSVHSTISSLRGILDYEERTGDTSLRAVRHRAEEYLLERRLLYRLSTGERIGPWLEIGAYPPRAVYTIYTALDYLRGASQLEGTAPDPRAGEAVELIRSAAVEGRWLQQHHYAGEVWFDVDVPVGQPSPWLTLQALRILRWWDQRA